VPESSEVGKGDRVHFGQHRGADLNLVPHV